MKSFPWLLLTGLLLLAFLQRGAVYSAPREDLFGIYDGGIKTDPPVVFAGEERARVNVAVDILEGPLVPLIDYQYANYFGGSLVVSVLLVPFVYVMGPTIWTLRLFAMLLNLAALALLFVILNRWVSKRAAIFACILWAFATPGFLINSMVVWGSHVESNVLALGTVWLFLSIHSSGNGRTWKRLLLGIMQGFNMYIGYQSVLYIGMLGFFDLHPKRFPKPKQLAAHVTGFVIGLAPWLWYNLRNDFSGLNIYSQKPNDHVAGEGKLAKLQDLVTFDFPLAQWFPMAWENWGPFWNVAYSVMLLTAALLGMLWFGAKRRNTLGQSTPVENSASGTSLPSPAHIAGLFCLGFMAMYAVTHFGIIPSEGVFGCRYPLIAMPWLVLAAGVGFDRLARWSRETAVIAWAVCLGFTGTCGYYATVELTDADRFAVESNAPATDKPGHYLWLFSSYRQFPERYPALVRSIQERRSKEDFEKAIHDLFAKSEWLSIDQPGFNEGALEYAAQLREMRRIVLEEVPPELRASLTP